MIFIDTLLSLIALVLLEIILGIDNLVFLSILSEKLPKHQRKKARRLGLTFAWVTRLALLGSAVWITKLTHPLISVYGYDFSVRNIFLLLGGIFLIVKASQEIHTEVVAQESDINPQPTKKIGFYPVVLQIGLMDIIFSLDSVLTAIGLTNYFTIMAIAISIAIIVMIYLSEPVSYFIDKHPTIKMLGLSFLMLIGMVLMADGFSFHIPRAYVYVAMGFSLSVEALNHIRRVRRGHD